MKKIISKLSSIALIAIFALSPMQTAYAAAGVTTVSAGAQVSTVYAGTSGSVSYTVSLTGPNGSGTIALSTTGLPAGTIATFSAPSAGTTYTAPNLSVPGNWSPASITLTLTTSSGTVAGAYPFSVTALGNSGGETLKTGPATLTITATTPVAATVTASNKTYDGTTVVTTNCTLAGSPAGVTCSAAATFADKNVGAPKTVNISGVTLGGANAALYTVSSFNATTTANITALPIAVTAVTETREYNGTTGSTAVPIIAPALAPGDTSGFTQAFDSAAVGARTLTASGVANDGNGGNNYAVTFAPAVAGAINQKTLIASGTVPNKNYDGANTATVPAPVTLAGIVGVEDVTASAASATFADALVGAGKTVTVAGVTLGGAQAGNYTVAPTFTTTASILGAPVTATVTADNKTYDATNTATISTCTLSGVLLADVGNVTCTAGSATFSDKHAADGKTVTATGITLGGPAAGGYSLTSATATTTANITKKQLTNPAHYGLTTTDKMYDGTNAAPGTSILFFPPPAGGVIAGDTVTATIGSAAFDNANIGVGKTVTASGITLGGADGGNYQLMNDPITSTANISTFAFTLTPVAGQSKFVGDADPASYTYTTSVPLPLAGDPLSGALSRAAGEIAGTYNIVQGTLSATANYVMTFTPGVQFAINKKVQTITFAPIANKAVTAANFTVSPTSDSALAVTLVSDTPAVCTVAGTTVDVIGTVGQTCTLRASQVGDAMYLPAADAVQSFTLFTDVTAPVIAAHANVSGVEATSPAGATVVYTPPTASDDVDASVFVTCLPASGSTFALGTTIVTCNASDVTGNAAIATTFTVNVVDTTKPVIAAHGNEAASAAGPAGAVVTYTLPTVSDIVDLAVVATCAPLSGTTFAIGVTTVNCTATDISGNTAIPTSFTVTVTDTNAPVFAGVPANITQEATAPAGNVVTYTAPTATDVVDGPTPVSCTPVSGSTFPIATTTVTCTATDLAANTATATFTVKVQDTTAPVITVTGANLVTLTIGDVYTEDGATWTDVVDGSGSATVGGAVVNTAVANTYTVVYSYTDAAGNTGTASRDVIVNKKPQTITFGPIGTLQSNNPDFLLLPTASSLLPVTISSMTPGVCSVVANTVDVLAVGTCQLAAEQSGDATYLSAPMETQSFNIVDPTVTGGGSNGPVSGGSAGTPVAANILPAPSTGGATGIAVNIPTPSSPQAGDASTGGSGVAVTTQGTIATNTTPTGTPVTPATPVTTPSVAVTNTATGTGQAAGGTKNPAPQAAPKQLTKTTPKSVQPIVKTKASAPLSKVAPKTKAPTEQKPDVTVQTQTASAGEASQGFWAWIKSLIFGN